MNSDSQAFMAILEIKSQYKNRKKAIGFDFTAHCFKKLKPTNRHTSTKDKPFKRLTSNRAENNPLNPSSRSL
jgi:hypothetical protein